MGCALYSFLNLGNMHDARFEDHVTFWFMIDLEEEFPQ